MPLTAERQNQVTTINQVTVYQYAQTAAAIHQLKIGAYKSFAREKYAYRSPDAQTFRNKRPPQSLIDAGWTYTRVRFQRIVSHMSPRHGQWQEYQNLKRQATLCLAMRLILKANNGFVPEKREIADLFPPVYSVHMRAQRTRKNRLLMLRTGVYENWKTVYLITRSDLRKCRNGGLDTKQIEVPHVQQ